MPSDTPHFDDAGRLIAPKYGDVYFSAEDGLAETQFVFLEGNRLANRFSEMTPGDCFTIGETGFGTGLNFLATWQLFKRHAPAHAHLEFVSVEGFPLGVDTMRRALSPWPELAPQCDALLKQWGPIWPGTHRFRFDHGRVRLTLLVGEAAEVLSGVDASVNAWFLDGFAPSRNADMWSKAVFAEVARLSAPDANLATYTAAGFVRRGLQAVGFEIEKRPGFGTKRDMTVGWRDGVSTSQYKPTTTIVIGGSLAGAFAARALAEQGLSVMVLERQRLIDSELPALSPRLAALQPKISAASDANGRWLREGFASVRRLLVSDDALATRSEWQTCGTLQLAVDDRSERRLQRFVDQFGSTGLCQWIEAEQTESVCGVALPMGGVSIPRAGVIRPAGLCAGLLDHPKITQHDGVTISSLSRRGTSWQAQSITGEVWQAEAVIVANAMQAMQFEPTAHLDLRPVRGQVTVLDTSEQDSPLGQLRCPLFYGGYALPAINGLHNIGASFVPGDTDTQWRDTEHAEVCDKLARVLPAEAARLTKINAPSGWVGLRVTTKNHRCYAEQIEEGLYVSLGHGSHGIASAASAGEHLAALITGGVRSRQN